jgi:hypothetical protein
MTNVGTIPDETNIKVKLGDEIVGFIAEPFVERLKKGDVFVLGGQSYEFRYTRGTTARVISGLGKPPTVPSWFSEMLPLSFDLAMNIQHFRYLMHQKFKAKKTKKEIKEFIQEYLYVDKKGTNSIYEFFKEQYYFSEIPNEKKIVIEYFQQDNVKYVVFHTLFGRRTNDVISRAIAYAISKINKVDVEINITDNGFFIRTNKKLQIIRAIHTIKSSELRKLMELAISKSEILSRRFRHCAARSLMVLRNYKGRTKSVGRQQMSSRLLLSAVKRISENFPILKEAKREILEDAMDIESAEKVFEWIENEKIKVVEKHLEYPSPFSFELITSGYSDLIKMEDKQEFLQRMHKLVTDKIENKKNENLDITIDPLNYARERFEIRQNLKTNKESKKELIARQAMNTRMPKKHKQILAAIVQGNVKINDIPKKFMQDLKKHIKEIKTFFPPELKKFTLKLIKDDEFDYDNYWDAEEQKKENAKEEQKNKLVKHFLLAARKDQLDKDIIENVIRAIEENKKLSDKTEKWIKELFSKAVKKHWKDDIAKWLKKQINNN